MNYSQLLLDSAKNNLPLKKIATKIYFLSPSCAFENRYDLQLDLYEEICEFLDLPLSAIRLVGSAHTGFSLVKNTPFDRRTSDLDIAVVDGPLYLRMFEHAFLETEGWKNVAKFSGTRSATIRRSEFLRYLERGIIRPDLMPSSPHKARWENFFGKLADKYSHVCNGISAGIYARESFMSTKQQSAIQNFFANRGIA